MQLRAGVTGKTEDKNVPVNDTVNDMVNDTINVQVNDTIKISQLTERQRKIYEAIKSGAINDTTNDTINDTINDTKVGEPYPRCECMKDYANDRGNTTACSYERKKQLTAFLLELFVGFGAGQIS